jgi:hypothetical protein
MNKNIKITNQLENMNTAGQVELSLEELEQVIGGEPPWTTGTCQQCRTRNVPINDHSVCKKCCFWNTVGWGVAAGTAIVTGNPVPLLMRAVYTNVILMQGAPVG